MRPIGSASGRSRSGRSTSPAISAGEARRRSRSGSGRRALGDDLALHQCVLAYASDITLLDTALFAHGRFIFDPSLMLASLDHAIWFHRFRADDWLLYAQDSPNSGGGRAFCRGTLFTRYGELVASTAQEGLVRKRLRDRATRLGKPFLPIYRHLVPGPGQRRPSFRKNPSKSGNASFRWSWHAA